MAGVPLDPSAVGQQLERILASPGFARNPRMSRFLRWLVERHLEHRDDELKESVIAVEVFGRRPDYDPKLDSIVRTEATRLRARLTEYYAGSGAGDPICIEVPKGRYVPAISARVPAETPRRRRVLTVAALSAAMVILGAGGAWYALRERAPVRIAVLPFRNLNPGAEMAFIVDGLTDEIVGSLAGIEGLSVRSRASSYALKDPQADFHDAGRRLGVDYLLDGSVLVVGEQLRVNVQLVRVADDSSIWSARFDRQLSDVLAIQDDIAVGIVNNLRLQLGTGRRRYETSVEAYTLYLRARARSRRDLGGAPESIDDFERAIAIDPSFAPAYAGLAATLAIRSVQFPNPHPPDEVPRMLAAAERAVALDPLLAQAQAALGLAQSRAGQWDRAEASFRQATALDLNDADALTDFAMWHLNVIGRNREALEVLRRAEAADPLAPKVQVSLAWILMSLGDYAAAAGHCEQLPAGHEFRSLCVGRALEGQGRHEEAVRVLSADPALSGNPMTRGFLGYALARSGRREDARRMADATSFANEQALIFAGLDDRPRALDALSRMNVVGAQRVGQYLNYPELAALKSEPALVALREQSGLPR